MITNASLFLGARPYRSYGVAQMLAGRTVPPPHYQFYPEVYERADYWEILVGCLGQDERIVQWLIADGWCPDLWLVPCVDDH